MQLLKQAFAAGHPSPMDVVNDTYFHLLYDHPGSRFDLRNLLSEYATLYEANMTHPKELRAPIPISGQFINQQAGMRLADLNLKLIQADTNSD